MQRQASSQFWPAIFIFIISLLAFTIGAGNHEIIGFESRFYLFALEMWRHGPSFFPTTYHQFYPDYPATSTLGIYLFAKGFQQLNPLTAILPSAIAAAFTMVATFLIGARQSREYGWMACCWLILTLAFFQSARTISLDLYTTCFTAWCYYLLPRPQQRIKLSNYLPLIVLLAFSFFCRGPIGFVIPAGVICSTFVVRKDLRNGFSFALIAAILLSLLTVLLLFVAYREGGAQFMSDVINMEVIGRWQGEPIPIYYYWLHSFFDFSWTFPIVVLMLLSAIRHRKKLPKNMLELFAWVGIILIGMSLPGDKKIRYILPIVPALALLAAYPLTNLQGSQFFSTFRKWILRFLFILPILYFFSLAALFYYENLYVPDIPTQFALILCMICLAQFGNILIWFKYRKRAVPLMTLAAITFALSYSTIAEPVFIHFEKSQQFVETIERLREANRARLVFYRVRPDGLAIKYLVHMDKDETPQFIDGEDALLDYSKRAYFVASEDSFEALAPSTVSKIKVITTGQIGHANVVIFKFK